jgi:hypothetical protein
VSQNVAIVLARGDVKVRIDEAQANESNRIDHDEDEERHGDPAG